MSLRKPYVRTTVVRSRAVLAVAALCGAKQVLGQRPITYDSLAALQAPAPTARIAYGPGPLQYGNLRLPKGPGPHPVVVFVHGGCFLQHYTIAHAAALEQAVADSGYAVWSIEYRRVGDEGGGWPGTFEDVARAADYLRVLARTYPLDLGRVVAAGHSAGGALVMWLASRDRLRADSPLRGDRPLAVGAVLAIAPATDFADLQAKQVCGGVMDKLMGGSPESFPERYRDVSPALLAPIRVPQVIVVGGQDRNWGPGGKAYYASAVAARDSLVRMVEVPEAGHFDVVAPTTAAWAVVVQALRDSFGRIAPVAPQRGVPSVDRARYAARRAAAYERLGSNLLVVQSRWAPSHSNQAGFDQDATFYYFTGAERLIGALLVLDGSTRRAEVFVQKPAPGSLAAMSQSGLGANPAASLGVDRVSDWTAFAPYVERWLADHPRGTMFVDGGGIDAEFAGRLSTPFDSLQALANPHASWRHALRTRWPNAVIATDTAVGPALRAVKDSTEIAVMRRVAKNSAAAFLAGLPRFGAGRHQREVEAAVVETCTRLGDGPSFWPWAMTGPNAAFPTPFSSFFDPHALDREMKSGEVARYDLGCKLDRYVGDVGRTLPVTGTFTPDQREVVDLLVAVYRAGLSTLRDRAEAEGLLRASVAEAARLRGTMRTPLGRHAAALLSNPDSLPFWQWHGIGLDVAEPLPGVLRAGMVLDYEPIFVVDGQGFYMEDMILVTKTGYEILTKGLPSTAAEIERAMRR